MISHFLLNLQDITTMRASDSHNLSTIVFQPSAGGGETSRTRFAEETVQAVGAFLREGPEEGLEEDKSQEIEDDWLEHHDEEYIKLKAF